MWSGFGFPSPFFGRTLNLPLLNCFIKHYLKFVTVYFKNVTLSLQFRFVTFSLLQICHSFSLLQICQSFSYSNLSLSPYFRFVTLLTSDLSLFTSHLLLFPLIQSCHCLLQICHSFSLLQICHCSLQIYYAFSSCNICHSLLQLGHFTLYCHFTSKLSFFTSNLSLLCSSKFITLFSTISMFSFLPQSCTSEVYVSNRTSPFLPFLSERQ